MANTENIESKLAAYVDNELDEAGRAEIEQHLAANPQHRALIEDLRKTREYLSAVPHISAPPEVAEMLAVNLERAALLGDVQIGADTGATQFSRWPQFRAIAAVLVLTCGLAFVLYKVLPSPKPSPTNVALVTPENPTPHPRGESNAEPLATDRANRAGGAAGDAAGGMRDDAAGTTRARSSELRRDATGGAMAGTPLPAETALGTSALGTSALGTSALGTSAPGTSAPGASAPASISPAMATPGAITSSAGGGRAANVSPDHAVYLIIDTPNVTSTNEQVVQYLAQNRISWQPVSARVAVRDPQVYRELAMRSPVRSGNEIAKAITVPATNQTSPNQTSLNPMSPDEKSPDGNLNIAESNAATANSAAPNTPPAPETPATSARNATSAPNANSAPADTLAVKDKVELPAGQANVPDSAVDGAIVAQMTHEEAVQLSAALSQKSEPQAVQQTAQIVWPENMSNGAHLNELESADKNIEAAKQPREASAERQQKSQEQFSPTTQVAGDSVSNPSTAPALHDIAVPETNPMARDREDDRALEAGETVRVRAREVKLPDVEPVDETLTIAADGGLALPSVGRVQAAGITPKQLAADAIPKAMQQAKGMMQSMPMELIWTVERIPSSAAPGKTGPTALPATGPAAADAQNPADPTAASPAASSAGTPTTRETDADATNSKTKLDVVILLRPIESGGTVNPGVPATAPAIEPPATLPSTQPDR